MWKCLNVPIPTLWVPDFLSLGSRFLFFGYTDSEKAKNTQRIPKEKELNIQ
jgi:hypothetical protein